MMKLYIVFFANILLFSISLAKPSLVMNEKAEKFLKVRNVENTQQSKLKNESFNKKPYSYVVLVDESSNDTYAAMKQRLVSFFKAYEPEKNVLRIKKENVKVDLSDLELNRNSCARKILEKVMPNDYGKMFVLVTVDLERSFSKSQGVQIEGYTFNFKRLFDNRVVRNNKNYLIVRMDKNGYLRSADIRLQDLTISTEKMSIDANYDENRATLDSLVNITSDFVNVVNEKGDVIKENVDKVVVNSVADAYCEIEIGGKKILIPCLSYASKMVLSNKESFGYIFDVPYSRKSWSDYQHENPSARFIRYSR